MASAASLFEAMLKPSAPVFVIGGLIILLVPLLLHFFLHRSTSYTSLPSILVVGPSGAGKTALLTLLERGPTKSAGRSATAAATHTSQIPSAVELFVSEDGTSSYRDDLDAAGATAKKFLLIDTPGHGKLRSAALARLDFSGKSGARTKAAAAGTASLSAPGAAITGANATRLRGVVFMADAAALGEADDALPATAEYLYDVLLALQKRTATNKRWRAPATVPVLVAANKADLFTALPATLVRSQLEAELARVRRSRSKGLLDSGVATDDAGAEDADEWLGEYGSDKFAFGQMREFDIEVEVVAGNVVGDGPGVDKWWQWMASQI